MTTLFATELKRVLDRTATPRQEIAESLGVHKQMLWLLQAGKRLPTPMMVDQLARVLELSPLEQTRLHRCAARDRGYRI